MYKLVFTNRFDNDVKLLQRRGFDINLLKRAVVELEKYGQLSNKYNPHKLSGNYKGYWEAHLKPNWLIIWKLFPDDQEIWLTRTGTHSDLF